MQSVEYMKIAAAMDDINKNFGRSFDTIRDLKLTGRLDYLYLHNGIHNNFEIVLRDFLDKLYTDSFNIYPHTRKISLYNYNNLIDCYNHYSYDLGAYFNNNLILTPQNNKIWLVFSRFIKAACMKYGIEPYASMTEDQLGYRVGSFLDLNCGISTTLHRDGNHNEFEVNVIGHPIIDKEKYKKYDVCKNKSIPFNRMDIDEAKKFMSVDAERRVFEEYNKRIERCGQSYWIAKFFGDGYGYDILNYDYVNYRENLIEVKSSTENEYFDLTENEFIVMTYTENITNTDYYVYKFFYKGNINNFTCKSYKYDKQRHMLVDTTDPSIVCEIEEGEKINDAGNRVKVYRCTPKKLENIKTLINKM